MQIFMLTLALCASLVAADVSHLSSSYLPPGRQTQPEKVISTSIEQQELHELPEQVEYMHEQPMPAEMEHATSGQLTPPADMPAARYLPPAQPILEVKMAQPPAMQYMAMPQEQPEPATRYLPPQSYYQQYQQQLMQPEPQMQQLQSEEPAMQYVMDVQQPMAPSDMETMAYQPVHELRVDGYHYKAAEAAQRLRH